MGRSISGLCGFVSILFGKQEKENDEKDVEGILVEETDMTLCICVLCHVCFHFSIWI